jgi:glycosyltransferase involved in cell wall biosynthesis
MSARKSIDVVIATYNRRELLIEALQGLARQTLAPSAFAVIVVDDGSAPPVRSALLQLSLPYDLTILEQPNLGAAAARHHGIVHARGEVIVILDDDMRVPPELLAEHLAAHARGATLVLGRIDDEGEAMARKPIFERMHAALLRRQYEAFRSGRERPRGAHTCTGNVSFRLRDYLAVGGFDLALKRSEDSELGVRLEEAGAAVAFADAARTVHRSDVADLEVWMRRNFLYGGCDLRIARKHPSLASADPWRFFFLIHPASRVLVALSLAAPSAGARLSRLAIRAAMALDALGAERAALAGATVSYGLEYFRGMRSEAGSLGATLRGLGAYLGKSRRPLDA